MSLSRRLRLLLLCGVLQFGVLIGTPMPPERIRELLHQIHTPKIVHVLPAEDDEGGDPPPEIS